MNCFLAITCILAVTASTRATGLGAGLEGLVYAPGHASVDYYAYPRYAFEYSVKDPHTGDNKAQWEKRDGDVVKGAYQLVEPDGSLRVVEYWADDKSGFNAVVKRIGPNLHPVAAPVAPIYKAPIPLLESHGPVAPISIGPIAKYSGLADAPLLTGPYLGGGHAVSSASIYRPPIVPIKEPVAPILTAPVAHAPIDHGPIISEPIYKAPIISAPIYKAPIVSAPLAGPYYPSGGYGLSLGGHGVGLGGHGAGLEGHGVGLSGHGIGLGGNGVGLGGHGAGLGGHGAGLGGHGVGLGGHGLELGGHGLGGLGGYGGNLIKAPLAGYGYLEGLGSGLINKGYYPSVGLGHDYLGYKH